MNIIFKNMLKNGYFIFGIFLLTVLILSLTPNHFLNAQNNRQETYKQLSLFGDIFERVKEQYVEEVSDKELIEAAISGMLQSLDPHSASFQQMITQKCRLKLRVHLVV